MKLSSLILVFFLAVVGIAQDALAPRLVNLPNTERPVDELLANLEKQTGNRVFDRRSKDAPTKIAIGLDNAAFWPALDRLAEKLDARVNLYGEDGITLIDGPRRPTTIAYSGITRVELKSLDLRRDLENNQSSCGVHLDVAWEPRFEPFYLTVERVRGSFAADRQGKELAFDLRNQVAHSVAQRRAHGVELRLPAPDRSSPAIKSLAGDLKFLGPTRMLTCTFPGLKEGVFIDDGVAVALKSVNTKGATWTFKLQIENPPSTPVFESFQSWLDNNRIHLERGKEIWSHRPDDVEEDIQGRKATVTYAFTGAQNKGPAAGWTLVYRTPGRIVEMTAPFEFRDVPLP